MLGFMVDENIYLKKRLSEIIKYVVDKSILEEIENFHSSFIKQDELIGLLRNDLAELDQLLIREIFEDGKIINEIARKLNRFRSNILVVEAQFSKLKLAFNDFLLEILDGSNHGKPIKNLREIH